MTPKTEQSELNFILLEREALREESSVVEDCQFISEMRISFGVTISGRVIWMLGRASFQEIKWFM